MLNGALLALLPLIAFSRAVRNSTWFINSGIIALLLDGGAGSSLAKLYTIYNSCRGQMWAKWGGGSARPRFALIDCEIPGQTELFSCTIEYSIQSCAARTMPMPG